jgi:hypothetical protein
VSGGAGINERDVLDLLSRLALTFETGTPFYFLDPAFARMGGYAWWHRRLRDRDTYTEYRRRSIEFIEAADYGSA